MEDGRAPRRPTADLSGRQPPAIAGTVPLEFPALMEDVDFGQGGHRLTLTPSAKRPFARAATL
jgi:hypothetical protein